MDKNNTITLSSTTSSSSNDQKELNKSKKEKHKEKPRTEQNETEEEKERKKEIRKQQEEEQKKKREEEKLEKKLKEEEKLKKLKEEEEIEDQQNPAPFQLISASNLRPEIIVRIYADTYHHYYATTDWSPRMYIALAYLGFISVQYDKYLLPEIQRKYGVLHWKNLQIEKNVKKRSKKYKFTMNKHFDEVLTKIDKFQENNWLNGEYRTLLKNIFDGGPKKIELLGSSALFEVHTTELLDENGVVVAGEVGYTIGSTYTSLTGFFDSKSKDENGKMLHPSTGKIQMVVLGKLLEKKGISFWNLGHPPRSTAMAYKRELGAEVVSRKDFLNIWFEARNKPCNERVGCDVIDAQII